MFKTPLKLILAATVAMPAFLVTDLAEAGHKKHNKHHGSHHYSGHHGGHYSSHHYKPHYSYYPPVYYGGYYYGGHHRHRHHGNAGTYAGLAILGATLGYVIHKSSKPKYDNGYQGGYYTAPPPQAPQGYTPQQSTFDFSQCRATNEYETTIVVDGREQLAYGTACQLDDGTWVAGPMRIGN